MGIRTLTTTAIAVALMLGGCSADRIELLRADPATPATAGSCDPGAMDTVWTSFAQEFDHGTVDIDTYFDPAFDTWWDPTNTGFDGTTRPALASHLRSLQALGVWLPPDANFVLLNQNAFGVNDSGFHAYGYLNCVTDRLTQVQIDFWPPAVAGRAPTN
jgi:hypothetical protein